MRAVNLVPAELRGAGGPTRSGGAVYVLLAALAVALACVVVVTQLGRQIAERETQAAAVEADAQRAEARAATVQRYQRLANETAQRVARIQAVAAERVEWSKPLAQVAEFIGDEVFFASLNATAAPGKSAGGESNPLRAAVGLPALEIEGCARDHAAVARLMARLRAMDRVERVSLSASKRDEPEAEGGTSTPAASAADAGGGDQDGADCSGVTSQPVEFSLVIFLAPGADPAPAAGAASAATTAPAGMTAPGTIR